MILAALSTFLTAKSFYFDMHVTNPLVTTVFLPLGKNIPDGLVTIGFRPVSLTHILMVTHVVGHVHCAI